MLRLKTIAALCVLAGLLPPTGAMAADDVAALRAELDALKADYAKRVTVLEQRITELEAGAAAVSAAPPPLPAPPARGGGATAFNPAMSVILAGNYAHLSQDPATFRIAGFIPSGGEVGP